MQNNELLEQLRQAYDASSSTRESSKVQAWKFEERSRFLELLRSEAKTKLIDVGAGTGVHAKWFQDQGLEVVATDVSPELVRLCCEKGLDAHVMDFQHITLPPASFDAMFAMNCLLHVPRDQLQRTLTRLRHMLKPGGLLYWGQYGGFEFEGIWQDDTYAPKRFFSYLSNQELEREAGQLFELLDFRYVTMEDRGGIDYHAVTLRRAGGDAGRIEGRSAPLRTLEDGAKRLELPAIFDQPLMIDQNRDLNA